MNSDDRDAVLRVRALGSHDKKNRAGTSYLTFEHPSVEGSSLTESADVGEMVSRMFQRLERRPEPAARKRGSARKAQAFAADELSAPELYSRLRRTETPFEERAISLNELLDRNDSELALFVYHALEEPHDATWREILIQTAESVVVSDATLRQRLADRLFGLAEGMRLARRSSDEPAMFAGFRASAIFDLSRQSARYFALLAPLVRPSIMSLGLACIEILFSSSPPPDSTIESEHLARLDNLMQKIIDDDMLGSSELGGLAINLLAASGSVGVGSLRQHVERLVNIPAPHLHRIAKMRLQQVLNGWSHSGRPWHRIADELARTVSLL